MSSLPPPQITVERLQVDSQLPSALTPVLLSGAPLAAGECVEARYFGKARWFRGVIVGAPSARSGATAYTVRYDHTGFEEVGVAPRHIRRPPPQVPPPQPSSHAPCPSEITGGHGRSREFTGDHERSREVT